MHTVSPPRQCVAACAVQEAVESATLVSAVTGLGTRDEPTETGS